MFNTFFLLHRLICRVLCQKDFEKPPSEEDKDKDNSGTIPNIVIRFYVLKFSKKTALLSYVQGALQKRVLTTYFTENF